MVSISQGPMLVSAYFPKLKRLWDELVCITPASQCTCRATKEVAELKMLDQLMQFLMGFNEAYDHVRNRILMMDPLPNVSKAYSMILRIEKQKEVPDWYKNLVEQRKKNGASSSRALAATEPEDSIHNAIDEQAVSEIIRAELQRYFRGMEPKTPVSTIEDYDEFSGKSLGNLVLVNWPSTERIEWTVSGNKTQRKR
ncbi:UNVERIFIED_CONTAM: hypothetical protein Slati_2737900 [Sesamum latifolium]|uniref:Uncharacterized protein n=1 Tax=Sesamum latifolium TaxID=2727402 RepID=A0AAW2W1M7_9LAMI